MSYLLDVVYLLLIVAASPWLLWAALRHGKYREGWAAKFLGRIPRRDGDRPCVWFHAVSVGEVQQLQPLVDRMATDWACWEFVISTTTKAGYGLANRRYGEHRVFYCPLDFSWAVRAAARRVRPDLLVLVELELWPNLIAEAKRQGAKVAIVNGRLSETSFRGYRRLGGLLASTMRRLDLIAVQNDEYAARFRCLGARDGAIQVTGSLKFDGAPSDRANPKTRRLAEMAGIQPDDLVFLAGSTQSPEERLAIEAFRALSRDYPRLRLIVVPRHPRRFDEVADLLRRSALPWQRRGELAQEGIRRDARILLVDTIGELTAWWGTAHIAFVGGSISQRGGQNMIEPAAFGAAVSFGPNTGNFRDVVELLARDDAAVVVGSGEQLTGFVRRCLERDDWRSELGARARQLVSQQSGAADRTLADLARLVRREPSGQAVRVPAA